MGFGGVGSGALAEPDGAEALAEVGGAAADAEGTVAVTEEGFSHPRIGADVKTKAQTGAALERKATSIVEIRNTFRAPSFPAARGKQCCDEGLTIPESAVEP